MSEAKIKVSAVDNASRVLADVRGNLSDLERTAAAVGTALGFIGVTGVAGLAALARNAINGLDALNDLSDATGSSVENLSALEDIAARTGTSFDTVGSALVKFNAQLKDAKPGSGAEQALTALGLSVKDLKALDPAEALLKTSIALEGFADDGNKARLVQELFGKSIKDVAPLLKDLAEKGQLVATVTTEQAKAAESFNKEISALNKSASDLTRTLVGPLVESINQTIALFREGAKEGKSFYSTLVDEQLRLIGLNDGQKEYSAQLADVNSQLAKGESRVLVRNALLRKQAELQEKLNKLGVVGAGGGRGTTNPDAVDPRQAASELPDPKISAEAARAAAAAARDQKDRIDQLARSKELFRKLEQDARKEQEKAAQDELAAIQKSIDAVERRKEAFINSLVQENEALGLSTQKQREQLEEIGLTKEELNALTLARLDNTLANEQASLALANAMGLSYEEISALEQKVALLKEQRDLTAQGQVRQAAVDTKSDQNKASKDYADTLRGDLKGAFSAAFRDSQDPLQAFGNALENVMFSRASTALADALLGAGTPGGGTGLLGSLFSFDGGGYTGNASRSGGLDGKGGFMAMLHPQESIIDHTKGQSMGGGSGGSVTVNIIESPGNGGKTVQRTEGGVNMIDVMVEKIKGSIATDITSGSGAVPSAMAATYGLNRTPGAY